MGNPYFIFTAHFAVRSRQRGYRVADFRAVEDVGTFVADGIFVRKRDVEPQIESLTAQLRHLGRKQSNPAETGPQKCALVQEIERLRRLSGTFVPTEDGAALSIYRPCSRRLKHILRGRRMRRVPRRYAR